MSLIRFFKNWTLPLAMLCGAMGYFILTNVLVFVPLKPEIMGLVTFLTPVLIFFMLFFTFCKVSLSDLRPVRWHGWLLGLQTCACLLLTLGLIMCKPSFAVRVVGEGAFACIVCPTAMAAAVITGKLGGNAGSLTAYTLESNLLSAVLITVLCPLLHPDSHVHLLEAFFIIFYKVLLLLVMPFFAALLVRRFVPRLHAWCVGLKDISFYLWSVSLTMVMAQAVRILMVYRAHLFSVVLLILVSLVVCGLQFGIGKAIGGRYAERISGGQALGQKNTVFGIWMALSYLTPISAVAMGAYVVFQNTVNSWQLWRKRKCAPTTD